MYIEVENPNAQVTQQGIASSRLYPFNNSGHGVVIDEMDALNAALLRFLQESVKTTALK